MHGHQTTRSQRIHLVQGFWMLVDPSQLAFSLIEDFRVVRCLAL